VESGPGRGGGSKVSKQDGRARAKSATQRKTATGINAKHIGDLAELDFMLQAANRGFGVAKPFGDNEHYDVMVDAGGRIWRVQVKCAIDSHRGHFQVPSHWTTSKRLVAYTPADIDLLAAFIRPHSIWYLIPIKAIRGRLVLALHPFGARRRPVNNFEPYREAWHLLSPCGADPP
jgi:hypothetical protein